MSSRPCVWHYGGDRRSSPRRAQATAAAQRPAQVAAPPDPMLMFSVDHLPFALHGADVSAQFQQDFPLSRLLRHRRRAAEATALGTRAFVSRAGLDVELNAARAISMLDERRRISAVLDEQLALTAKLVAATMARFSSGRAAQGDVLQAQSAQARLRAERRALDAEIRGAEAMLRAALALPQETLIPPLASVPLQTPSASRSSAGGGCAWPSSRAFDDALSSERGRMLTSCARCTSRWAL